MRKGTYLNVILTVNAVLLGAIVWTQIAERPLLAGEAMAQVKLEREPGTNRERAVPEFPNSTAFRAEMIGHQRAVIHSLEEIHRLLAAGKMRVEVTNLKDVKIEVPQR